MPVLAAAAGVLLFTGCHLMRSTVQLPDEALHAVKPGGKGGPPADPELLQDNLMRFADRFSGGMVDAISTLATATNGLGTDQLLQIKINFFSQTLAVAAGPNPFADLLDMTVLVTLSHKELERYWVPRIGAETLRPVLTVSQESEKEIWKMAASVLTPVQQADLRKAIDAWFAQSAGGAEVLTMRAVGLASEVEKTSKTEATGGANVFSLLRINPLSGLDPAAQELAQTRLVAERALYVAQRMPQILRLQTELLGMELAGMPQVDQMVTNTTQFAAAANRLSELAGQLPERLAADKTNLTQLLVESRQTLVAGDQMSTSLNTTITNFNALMKRFGVGEPSPPGPPDTNTPPFNILDYATTADKLAQAATQINTLLQTFNETLNSPAWNQRLEEISALARRTQQDANASLDRLFLLGAALVALAFASALVYRFVAHRILKIPR
jgi:hypothetical protein